MIPGWFDFADVYDLACQRWPKGRFVEIGAWLGRSTAYLAAKHSEPIMVVDTWQGSNGRDTKSDGIHYPILQAHNGDIFNAFLANMVESGTVQKVIPLRMRSTQAALLFADECFDFVFIDAGHDERSISEDINAWLPKVKPGGLLAGHDYDDENWPAIKKVVDKLLGEIETKNKSWLHWRK